ncbi:AMP-dependent synthetase/ligase [Plasticicumulans acidivorans]|nr:AMP-binding protein [Plasticicumulans acidivorans]
MHARERPGRPAIREKDLGIWQEWSWEQMAAQVRALACGLAAMGFGRGDKLAIVGDNRPRLYWAMAAAQTLGGVPVPLYQDAVAEEMAYVLADADIRFAVVEDQEQVDKLLEVKDRCPQLEWIIYEDPRGMRHYRQPCLRAYAQVQSDGRQFEIGQHEFFERAVARTRADDISVMLYTSGTTGKPKGVVLTHEAFIVTARAGVEREGLDDRDEVLAYLPMAWVGDHLFSYAQSYVAGFCVSCPEGASTVMTDMREIGPSYFFAPPRVFENLLTQVMIRMEDAGAFKRRLFHYFMELARRVGTAILDGRPVSTGERLQYALGRVLVYGPLKNVLGFSRIKLAYTAGEAIGPEIFDFFRALGINVKQFYGSTETAATICVQPNGQVRADTVGVPAAGVEVRIADSGEVLVRSKGTFHSYYKRPDDTAEAKDAEGWLHTGDAGYFDDEGHLRIIDRAKDVGKLADGTLFAPKFIENKLKFFPFIKEAVTFGDQREYVAAFINIDLEAVGNWAEKRGLAYSGYTDLAAQDVVYTLVRECIEKVNADLAADSRLSGSQIKRFLVLHKELDADDGELTRTRKVRRRFIAERYATLIEALYSARAQASFESEVRFEDGRSGLLRADLKLREAERFGVHELRKAS